MKYNPMWLLQQIMAPTFPLLLEAVPQPLDLGPVLLVEVAVLVLQEPTRNERGRAE